jgi:hypothetical protein
VNEISVSEERSALVIKCRKFAEEQVVHDGGYHVVCIGRASFNVNGFDACDFPNALGLGWIGFRCLNSPGTRTVPHTDCGGCVLTHIVCYFKKVLP